MKSLHRLIFVTSAVATLAVGASNLQAQDQNQNPGQGRQRGQGGPGGPGGPGGGRGNFDPAQFRERMQQMMRERFDVKDDEEWKLISERITKVTEAQRGIRPTGGFGGFPGGRTGGGGPPGGGGAPGGDNNGGGRTRGGGGPGGPGGFGGGTPDPDMDALNKAIEAKASPDEIKAKLARVRDARKDKEAKLEAAQEELRQVLSARQEAIAVTMGLLK